MIDAVEVGRPASPKTRVAFEVGDAARMTAALVDGGATLVAAPTETPWRSLNSRLEAPAGCDVARDLFVLMAEVFGEPTSPLSDAYVVYDIAVAEEHQRRGVGKGLMEFLLEGAAGLGIDVVFVPADDDDVHALDFYRALNGSPSAVTMFEFATGSSRRRV